MIRKAAMLTLIVTIVFAVTSCSKDKSAGPKDKVPPTVTITNSWDTAKAAGITRQGVVDIEVEATDIAGINRVELFVNSKLYATDTTKPYAFEWDMGTLADASENVLYVRAVDGNGNKKQTDTVTVTKGVSNSPVATLAGPADGTTIKQGDTLTLTGSASDTEDGSLSDSQIIWKSNLQGLLGQGLSLDHRGLIIGEHVLTMTAIDTDGNMDEKTIKVTVTDNGLTYATIEKGTYYLGEPLFPKRTVRLRKALYISKTELSVKEFLELRLLLDGEKNFIKWVEKRNKALYNTDKKEGLYQNAVVFSYKKTNGELVYSSKDILSYEEDATPVYGDYPACFITFIEAVVACNSMSDRDGLEPAYIYLDKNDDPIDDYSKMKGLRLDRDVSGWRLPTEAEWEVAAYAGLEGAKFPWGDYGPGGLCNSMSDPTPPNALDVFNGRGPVPVTSYEPNRYGLYNIVGNIGEICADMFVGIAPSGVDPLAVLEEKNPSYICKGGAWYEFGQNMQIPIRHLTIPFSEKEKASSGSGIGLRVVRNAD